MPNMKPLLEVLTSRGILSRIPASYLPALEPYTFIEEFRRRRFYGYCHYSTRQIALCGLGQLMSKADQDETILHECAHAIAGHFYREYKHGPAWQRVAIKLGVSPSAFKNSRDVLTYEQQQLRRMGLPVAAIVALSAKDNS